MVHLNKHRRWVMAASLAALLLGLLVLGMSYASAQTATPVTTGTPDGTAAPTAAASPAGTSTIAASPVATTTASGSPTAEATGAASPTAEATGAASPTAESTAAATTAPTSAATAAPTARATATVTASLQISLPQQFYLPLDLALQAASAALEECADQGYRVAVTIVDQSGVEKVVLKGDNAGPHTLGSSFKKAFTSASTGSATLGLVDRVQKDPTLSGLGGMDERILLLAGGLPIRINNQIVGGIGVGGAPSGLIDQECAQAGLDSLEE